MRLDNVHEDYRGSIYTLTEKDELCNILFTNKGKARGGCVHDLDEHLLVISGEIELFLLSVGYTLRAGSCISIPKTIPHYFVSVTDSIVSESGTKGKIRNKYQPHLDKINEINSTN